MQCTHTICLPLLALACGSPVVDAKHSSPRDGLTAAMVVASGGGAQRGVAELGPGGMLTASGGSVSTVSVSVPLASSGGSSAATGGASATAQLIVHITTASNCTPGSVHGTSLISSICFTPSELQAFGCTLIYTRSGGEVRQVNNALDYLRTSRFSLSTTDPTGRHSYLCDGTPPQIDWLCSYGPLGLFDATLGTAQPGGPVYQVDAIATYETTCFP